MSECSRTIVLLTPPGRGAVAVVQVTGPDAAEGVDRFLRTPSGKPLASQPIGRIAFGTWQAPGEASGEELVAVRRSEKIVEVQCHGGDAAVETIERHLAELGFQRISWQAAGDDEAGLQVPRALTLRTAAILLDQAAGAMKREVQAILEKLDQGDCAGARLRVEALLARAALGAHLTDYWRIAITGEPNVGKSSLMNAIVGFRRAIVHDTPGTTRDAVTARTAINGWPMEFIDTAGLRDTVDPLEAAGIALARAHMEQADLVLDIRDASRPIMSLPHSSISKVANVLVVWNKGDLVPADWSPPTQADEPLSLVVSATTGDGLEPLLSAIAARLIPEVPSPGAAVPITGGQCDNLSRALHLLNAKEMAEAAAVLRWL